ASGGATAGEGTGARTGARHLGDPGGPPVRSRDRQLPDRGVGPRRPPRRPGPALVGGAGEPVAVVSRAPGRRRRGPPGTARRLIEKPLKTDRPGADRR